MNAAYSYLRWSTKGQGSEARDSRRRQTESAEKWIREHGNGQYHLSKEVFIDAGKSGFKGKHIEVDDYGVAKGELMRFIQLYEQGKIAKDSIILFDSVDRFGRMEVPKQLSLFLSMLNAGIGIVFTSLTEKRVITSALLTKEPYLLYVIIGEIIRSYTESAEKSRKIKEAKARKRKTIQAGVIVPHNLMPKYFTFVPIANGTGKYIHNDNTKIVKELIDGIQAGKSLYQMTVDLNNRKIKTFRYGDKWHPCSVRQILRNRVLIGEWQGVKDYVPAIIDESEFTRVQNILNLNKFNRGTKSDLVNIFRSMAYCGHCGQAMVVTGGTKKGLSYRYLRCSNYYQGTNVCSHNFIRLEPMEKDFLLKFLAKDPWKLLEDDDSEVLASLQRQITAKTAQLNAVNTDVAKVVALVSDMSMDDLPEVKDRLNTLRKEREKIKVELDELNVRVSSLQDTPQYLNDILVEVTGVPYYPDNPNFKGTVITTKDDAIFYKVIVELGNNEWREKFRVTLPNLIGKITVLNQRFTVYNRMSKKIFESEKYGSLRNSSDEWKARVRKGINKYWANKRAGK